MTFEEWWAAGNGDLNTSHYAGLNSRHDLAKAAWEAGRKEMIYRELERGHVALFGDSPNYKPLKLDDSKPLPWPTSHKAG